MATWREYTRLSPKELEERLAEVSARLEVHKRRALGRGGGFSKSSGISLLLGERPPERASIYSQFREEAEERMALGAPSEDMEELVRRFMYRLRSRGHTLEDARKRLVRILEEIEEGET